MAIKRYLGPGLLGISLLLGLWIIKLNNFLLFHSIAEGFSIVVAYGVFMLAWNSREIAKNNYLLFIGIAYLFVGCMDLIHTFSYKGMGVFLDNDTNLGTQVWIATRYVESISLLIAPFVIGRRLNPVFLFVGFSVVSGLLLRSIFYWDNFPVCFVEGEGLTSFKKISEYTISFILFLSAIALYKKRDAFTRDVFRLLLAAILVSIITELTFTLYVDAYGLSNVAGHYFKILSFYFVYKAIVETGLMRPYSLLFADLKRSEDALHYANENLERQVDTRTVELMEVNETLQAEITERNRAESDLRDSEARFRTIFEQAATGVALIESKTGRFHRINQCYCDMVGYTIEEMSSGKSFQEITHPEDLQRDLDYMEQLLDGEIREFSMEKRYFHKDGSVVWVNLSIAPTWASGEEPHYHIAVAVDITDRKKAQAEKDELDARSSAIIEYAVDGIITIDERGLIESMNPAAEIMFGYTRFELLGQNVKVLVPEPDRGEHDGYLERYRDTGVKHIIDNVLELEGERKDGVCFPLKLSLSEIQVGEKRIFTGIVHDLTHEAALESQLLQAQKMESLGTLAGGIAHDFNNILQAISGFTQLAQESQDGDHQEALEQYLVEIEAAGQRASDLVKQILTFSRKSDVETMPIALQPLIEEALKFLRSSMPSTVQIESDLDPDCGSIGADTTQIHQIITNLCTNSMHAMEENGGTLSISLKPIVLDASFQTLTGLLGAGEYLQLSVADTGMGIPEELFEHIFDPFFTTKEVGKGTGLGLSVIHGIVKGMGAGLTVESELDRGTTICILFSVLHDIPKLEPVTIIPRPALVNNNGSQHVLIVDDEEAITKLTSLILESRGFTVEAYNDVDSALDAFQGNPEGYTVAILDYTMPKKTGLELAHEFQLLNPGMPVILVSGLLEQTEIGNLKPGNVIEIIKKPFDMDELLKVLVHI